MAKVIIKGLAKRKVAKQYGKVAPQHKPGTKVSPAKANVKKPTVAK